MSTTIDAKTSLVEAPDPDPVCEPNLYQRMIASLMYLIICARPDAAFSVSYLSCCSSNPLQPHHTARKRVFRYLAVTHPMSTKYKRSST